MLKVDLGLLRKKRRLAIDLEVPADDPLVEAAGIDLDGPLRVALELQSAGADVVARGTLAGAVRMDCRRCLEPVVDPFEEPVTIVLRAGASAVDAEAEEAWPLPEQAREVDLTDPVREHLVLAVPEFTLCRPDCRGLCPSCGIDLNRGSCDCMASETDERWAALKRLGSE
jgi:uncharacterized protein